MTAFLNIDIPAGQLFCAIKMTVLRSGTQGFLKYTRQDLNQAANGGHKQNAKDQQTNIIFQLSMQGYAMVFHAGTSRPVLPSKSGSGSGICAVPCISST